MKLANEHDPLGTSAIQSRQGFAHFLNHLLVAYQSNGKDWENQKLGDFLEALAAYATDIDGYYRNISSADELVVNADVASWRVFADMLRGATIYE
ncbi:hypothetical protein ACFQ48_01460 [Hymenobacter caeli]|uniref:DUF7660 domain-containing protein n=1 Tax=Hymenobacter caeli TaxID=2735894 RepID=A0ABX2FK40_9BACT|nr:hypothetical protein [Hymenobacter caeli]NRT17488.1 hypothetical protein [Hymenobacter caeli]